MQKAWGCLCNSQHIGLCKYEKDGKLKKSFRKVQRGSTASKKKTASLFAQLLAKIVKLKKMNEKLKKMNEKLKKSSPKQKHDNGSDSDDSDSP